MPRPRTDSLHRLLVEGPDDLFSIAHLIKARFGAGRSKIDFKTPSLNAPYIESAGGYAELLKVGVIEAAVKTHPRLGIVLDADHPPSNRWRAVIDRLKTAGVALLPEPHPDGVVVPGYRPDWKVGVWLMPDNGSCGALEEFLAPLIPPGDPLWAVAVSSTTLAADTKRLYGRNDDLKARLHCFLAWQENPGAGFGPALSQRALNPLNPKADLFVQWFYELFG